MSEGLLLNVYIIKVQYGRLGRYSNVLVAADSLREAKKLAKAAALLPVLKPIITGYRIPNLVYRTDVPMVIYRV